MKKIRKSIEKRIPSDVKIVAMSELPVIGKVDDPDGFFDNVKKNGDDITRHITAYLSKPLDVYTAAKVNEQISYLHTYIDFRT